MSGLIEDRQAELLAEANDWAKLSRTLSGYCGYIPDHAWIHDDEIDELDAVQKSCIYYDAYRAIIVAQRAINAVAGTVLSFTVAEHD